MHLSESRARKNNVLFHKLQAAGISVVTESLFGFTKLILHHPRVVTAASRGSTIANLALRITHQPEPYILRSRFTHALPCLTLISTVRALVCATAPPVRSPAKASAILNESVTAVTASRFSPVTGGNRTKLPSSRWRRRGRSLREVFACSCFFATTDLSQIYHRETWRHGTPCTKTTDSCLFWFLYNNPRKIRRETTVGKFVPNNGRR